MVSEEKVESGFRNVGGDRFNKVHRLQRLVVVVVFSGFRGGKGRAGLGLGTLEVRDSGVC